MLHAMRFTGDWREPRAARTSSTAARPTTASTAAPTAAGCRSARSSRSSTPSSPAGSGWPPSCLPQAQHDRADWPRQRALVAAAIAGRPRDEWAAVFAGTDACVDARSSRRARCCRTRTWPPARVFTDVDGLVHPAPAPRFSRTPGARGSSGAARRRAHRGGAGRLRLQPVGHRPARDVGRDQAQG